MSLCSDGDVDGLWKTAYDVVGDRESVLLVVDHELDVHTDRLDLIANTIITVNTLQLMTGHNCGRSDG